VVDLSERETFWGLNEMAETAAHLMSDKWKAFVSIGRSLRGPEHPLSFEPRICTRPRPFELS
jgi:hypothetical protein